jgi:hypothetical protein
MEINIKGSIVLIDNNEYDKISKYKLFTSVGYCFVIIDGRRERLHHIILGKPETGFVVDHINNNKLDNRKENLRFASYQLNSQNKPKKDNTSSKYIGVGYIKKNKKWRSSALKKHLGYFETEIDAAMEYDRYIIKNLEGGRTNNLFTEEEIDIIKETYINKIDKDLPKGISYDKKSKLYVIRIKLKETFKYVGSSKNLDDALVILKEKLKEHEEYNTQKIQSLPIIRNSDGIAIIKTKKGDEILVDDFMYYKLIPFYWMICNSYAKNTSIDYMHRHIFVLNDNVLIDNMVIDHINNNRFDNRINNLRQISHGENNHNRTNTKNKTDKYKGVCFLGKKWSSKITHNNIIIYIGQFDNEKEAALAYNKKAIELYGNVANLNVIEDLF